MATIAGTAWAAFKQVAAPKHWARNLGIGVAGFAIMSGAGVAQAANILPNSPVTLGGIFQGAAQKGVELAASSLSSMFSETISNGPTLIGSVLGFGGDAIGFVSDTVTGMRDAAEFAPT